MANSTVLANTRRQGRVCIVLLVLLAFSLGVSEFNVIGIEAELASDFEVALPEVGQFISLFALTYAVATPVLTLVTGRFKRYSLLVAYALVFIAANLLSAFASSFATMLLARIALGLVSGTLIAVGVTYIPELVGYKNVPIVLSVVYASYSMAMIIATSVGKIMADTIGWHYVMYSSLALAVIVCAALFLIMPRSGSTDEPVTAKEQAKLLFEPCIVTGTLIFVFGVGSVYVFYGYITPYLQTILGMDTYEASTTLMAYGFVCLVSNLLGGVVDSKVGIKALLVIFPLLGLALLGLMLSQSMLISALLCMAAVALLMYSFSVSCITLFMRVANNLHPKALTLASSLEPLAFNIGISFGTAVGGFVVANAGLQYTGGAGALFAVAAFVMVAVTIYLSSKALSGSKER